MSLNYVDQLGIHHTFQSTPKRIISLVPSQTELLYDLGLEESIIGITKFCVHPYHFKSTKSTVGGTKKVNIEKIKKINPDIIICNKEENTPEIVIELSKICEVWVTDVVTIEDNLKMITDFGQLFNCRTEAQKWLDKINFALTDFKQFIAEKPIKKVAYFIWRDPYLVVGSNTYINEVLHLNHFKNIYDTKERYPEVQIQKMRLEGDPEIVFLSSEPFPFNEEHAFEIGRFTHHAKLVFVDGEMFSWHGTRLHKALNYFKSLHQKI